MSGTLVEHDQHAVQCAQQHAQDEDTDHDDDGKRVALALHEDGGNAARDGHLGTDGQVDAAGDDAHSLRNRSECEWQDRSCEARTLDRSYVGLMILVKIASRTSSTIRPDVQALFRTAFWSAAGDPPVDLGLTIVCAVIR